MLPTAHSAKTYSQLSIVLQNHIATKKLVTANAIDSTTQREGESVSTFAADKKHLASMCDFGLHLNEALRDCFVCALQSKENRPEHRRGRGCIFSRWLHFGEQVGFYEPSRFSSIKLRKYSGKAHDKSPYPSKDSNTSECLICGKTGHPCSQCKYRNYNCHSCGRVGHINEACKTNPRKVHKVRSVLLTRFLFHYTI